MADGAKSKLERVIYRSGQRIFKEGEIATDAYIIEEGSVEITLNASGDHVVVNKIGRGEIIGEMALFDDSMRSATARALEETTVLVVPRDELRKRLAAADPVLQRVVRTLVDRLRSQTRRQADRRPVSR